MQRGAWGKQQVKGTQGQRKHADMSLKLSIGTNPPAATHQIGHGVRSLMIFEQSLHTHRCIVAPCCHKRITTTNNEVVRMILQLQLQQ